MVTRKVQLTGSSTYTISLPKDWAREHGIEPGMQLTLCPGHNGELVIGAGQTEDQSPTVDLDTVPEDAVTDVIRSLYVVGVDRFTLSASESLSGTTRRAVSDATSELVGLEIARETESAVELSTPLDTAELGIERTLVQLQYVALSMQHDATTALVDGDADLAAQVTERRRDARRKYDLVNRSFQRSLTDLEELRGFGLDRPRVFDYFVTANRLDRVADGAERVAAVTLERDDPADDRDTYVENARRVRDLVDEAVEAVLDADDPVRGFEVKAAAAELRDSIEGTDATDPGTRLAVDTLRRTAVCAGDVATRAMQAALRER